MKTAVMPLRASLGCLAGLLGTCGVCAQIIPAPVSPDQVFSREQIGRALSAPTPEAGHTAPSEANAPKDDGQWTMPSKNYASTRFSSLNEITAQNVQRLTPVF